MEVLLINYDLNNETKRPPIVKRIKSSYPDHQMISESSYAVHTGDSPQAVYSKLEDLLDSDDNLIVFTLRGPYHGWHRKPVIEWLAGRVN